MLCPFVLGDQFCRVPAEEVAKTHGYCEKTFGYCRAIFHNEARFGGFPTDKDKDYE